MTIVYIVSAPSGSGKSTLVAELLKTVDGLDFSISYTTRPPRRTEQNRKEYFFVPRETFEAMVADDEFLEHADVFGNYYGTARRFLREAEVHGNDLLLDIDVQGAEQIQRKIPAAVSIFILPPDWQTLESRLRNRGSRILWSLSAYCTAAQNFRWRISSWSRPRKLAVWIGRASECSRFWLRSIRK
jgi:guanylate kinase